MGDGILEILQLIINSPLVTRAVGILIGLAVLAFLYGLARYILRTDDAEGKQGAKNIMIWGVITIFIMVSIWGFVALLQDISGTPGDNVILPIPQVPE